MSVRKHLSFYSVICVVLFSFKTLHRYEDIRFHLYDIKNSFCNLRTLTHVKLVSMHVDLVEVVYFQVPRKKLYF